MGTGDGRDPGTILASFLSTVHASKFLTFPPFGVSESKVALLKVPAVTSPREFPGVVCGLGASGCVVPLLTDGNASSCNGLSANMSNARTSCTYPSPLNDTPLEGIGIYVAFFW